MLANANKIIEEKVGAKLDIQYLGWGDYGKKMSVITSSGENYDIAFADNYIVNAQKGAYADLTELYKKEGKELYKALDPAYIKGNSINGKIYAVPVAANVASSQNFAFNGTLLAKYGIDISGVTSYETLEPVLKQIKEKAPDVVPFAVTKNFIPSDNFDYPVPNGLPFVIDLEGDTTKIVNLLQSSVGRMDTESRLEGLRPQPWPYGLFLLVEQLPIDQIGRLLWRCSPYFVGFA